MSTSSETESKPVEPTVEADTASGSGSEPGGRAQRPAGGARLGRGDPLVGLSPEVRDRLSDELIDELLAGARTEEEIVGPGGLLADLTRRLVERAMSAELTGEEDAGRWPVAARGFRPRVQAEDDPRAEDDP
jgi:hypothetical protein